MLRVILIFLALVVAFFLGFIVCFVGTMGAIRKCSEPLYCLVHGVLMEGKQV